MSENFSKGYLEERLELDMNFVEKTQEERGNSSFLTASWDASLNAVGGKSHLEFGELLQRRLLNLQLVATLF